MYVSDEHKLIFLAHPRTASRAVGGCLRDTLGFREVRAHHAGPNEGEFEGYRTFTTVRNHWDAWASWWYNAMGNSPEAVKRKMDVRWVRKWLKGHQTYFKVNQPTYPINRQWWFLDLFPPPAIMRYERLQEDFSAFLSAYGLPDRKLPVIGLNKFRDGRHYSQAMTQEAAVEIGYTFSTEITELRYTFA